MGKLMMPIGLLALIAVSLPVWAGENGEPDRENDREAASVNSDLPNWAQGVAEALKRLANEKLPGHVFTQQQNDPNGTVRIAWKTQAYNVPRPTGKQRNAPVTVRRETGPAADGLIVTVWLSDTLGAADRPHTLDNAGLWKTYLGHSSVPSSKKHLLLNVDYGPKTDKRLIELFSSPAKWLEAADGRPAGSADGGLPREEELALLDSLRKSELIVVGTLRRTDDSTANKMWAGHIDVASVLLGDPSVKDLHVHF